MQKTPDARFVYRDAVWTGQDMIGAGVASFSHIDGVHYQNAPRWEDYLGALDSDQLPLFRAFAATREEQLTREVVLQLKLGAIDAAYFRAKYDIDIIEHFLAPLTGLRAEGLLAFTADAIALTDEGLLRVDQLLPDFYDSKFRNARYT